MTFDDDQLERYARHIVLREIGGRGQQNLTKARIVCIGAGGLGSPALMYLAAAGIGTLGIVDDDLVSLSNLQRQIVHDTDSVGAPKTKSAQKTLHRINPHVNVVAHNERLKPDNASEILTNYDLVLDGCDNFSTRALVNEICVDLGIPLISGAITQWEGQVTLFDPAKGTPCYACIFPQEPEDGLAPSCAEAGVMGALAGIIGSMMATEAIKYITGAGQTLAGEIEIAKAFREEGANVWTCDIQSSSEEGIRSSQCDVSNRNQVGDFFEMAVSDLGGLDCLVNNAGIAGPTSRIEDMDPADWDQTLAICLTGQFNFARLAMPHLRQSNNPSMANLSSIGLTKSLAIEGGLDGVRVNAILPGLVAGDRQKRVLSAKAEAKGISYEAMEAEAFSYTSIKDYVEPSQIADQIVYLASSRARTISGQAISPSTHYFGYLAFISA